MVCSGELRHPPLIHLFSSLPSLTLFRKLLRPKDQFSILVKIKKEIKIKFKKKIKCKKGRILSYQKNTHKPSQKILTKTTQNFSTPLLKLYFSQGNDTKEQSKMDCSVVFFSVHVHNMCSKNP